MTRRRVLRAGAALLAASALEYESLSGKFDHGRDIVLANEARFRRSLELLSDRRLAMGAMIHVGHSTHLVAIDGVRFLTDPWFHDPAFGALAHEHALPARPRDIDPLDAILITHDHADHVDEDALATLPAGAVCLVATDGLADKAKRAGRADVRVLAPWESFRVRGVEVFAVPGLHDIYEIGFVLKGATKSVYFAGDSRLHPSLAEIRARFAPDAAILPVDGTRIRGGDLHVMRPEDAVEAARILNARVAMPSHAEGVLFDPLAKYVITENIERAGPIFADLMKRALPEVRCEVPKPGQIVAI